MQEKKLSMALSSELTLTLSTKAPLEPEAVQFQLPDNWHWKLLFSWWVTKWFHICVLSSKSSMSSLAAHRSGGLPLVAERRSAHISFTPWIWTYLIVKTYDKILLFFLSLLKDFKSPALQISEKEIVVKQSRYLCQTDRAFENSLCRL